MTQDTDHIPTQDHLAAVVNGEDRAEQILEPAPPAHFMLQDSPGTYNFPPYLATAEEALEFWGNVHISDDEIIRFMKLYNKVYREVEDHCVIKEAERLVEQWVAANPKKKLVGKSNYEDQVIKYRLELRNSDEVRAAAVEQNPLPYLDIWDVRHVMIAVRMYYRGPRDEWHPDEFSRARGIKIQLTSGIHTVDQVVRLYGFDRVDELLRYAQSTWYVTSTNHLEDAISREFAELKIEVNDAEIAINSVQEEQDTTNNLLRLMLPE